METAPVDLVRDRARWLAEMGYAKGDPALQAGWAEYVKAERDKLELAHPQAKAIAFARFKELSA